MRRKYPLTWELVEIGSGTLVGINTQRTNKLVHEALEQGLIEPLAAFGEIRSEVRLATGRTRVDFVLRDAEGEYFLEVKNVTAAVSDGQALFPDAVSSRATRHAQELESLCRSGHRAGMLFMVQRDDVTQVQPADAIDPVYGKALRSAAAAGVDVLAYRAQVSAQEITVQQAVQVVL